MTRRAFLAGSSALMGGLAMAGGHQGYVVPAEEARHEMCLMQWPVSRRVHPDRVFLEMLQGTIAEVALAIAAFEPVVLLADRDHHADLRRRVGLGVTLWDVPTEDLWARDSGPIVGVNGAGSRAVRHIRFNGWGGKQVHRHDGKIAQRVADRLSLPLIPSPLKGEAGGVEQDGHGLLVAHESSWVEAGRNPGMTRDQIETALLNAYGADRMIWAPGLQGEDITDYHIDSLCRLTGPGRVLMCLPDQPDPGDPFHRAALKTRDVLIAAGLKIDVIPEPRRRRVRSADFVASYVNYYVANGAVIAPQFGDADTDKIAAQALARHYPGREIVLLNTDPLGEVGGGIHCATHQVPA